MKTPTLSALSALLALALTGCAKINDAGMKLVSSTAPAMAMVNGQLLSGEASLFIDRSGTLNLESSQTPPLKCMGTLRYTATRSGVISLQCSDGNDVLLTFNAIGETSGYGYGRTAQDIASLVFGLEPADGAAYLKMPAGKRIVTTPEGEARLAPL